VLDRSGRWRVSGPISWLSRQHRHRRPTADPVDYASVRCRVRPRLPCSSAGVANMPGRSSAAASPPARMPDDRNRRESPLREFVLVRPAHVTAPAGRPQRRAEHRFCECSGRVRLAKGPSAAMKAVGDPLCARPPPLVAIAAVATARADDVVEAGPALVLRRDGKGRLAGAGAARDLPVRGLE
jgi:hypothetical protein